MVQNCTSGKVMVYSKADWPLTVHAALAGCRRISGKVMVSQRQGYRLGHSTDDSR